MGYSEAMLSLGWLVGAAVLLLAPAPAAAVEYSLRVSHLLDRSFDYFVRGPIGKGEGELPLPALESALDAGKIGSGALLYDRQVHPAGKDVALAFGAVAVRPTAYASAEDSGLWTTVRWEGKPGQRVVWVLRPSTTQHLQRVAELALSGTAKGLRYFIPYGVTLSPTPSVVVSIPLTFLRSSESGVPIWEKFLVRAVDLSRGLAAVVGGNTLNDADWVYVVIQQPADPTTFSAVVAWKAHGGFDVQSAGAVGIITVK